MTASSSPSLLIQAERPADASAVAALVERVFGPGRLTKVSERVREFAAFRPDLSFCAWDEGRLAGVVRQWLVHVGTRQVVFLGPLAVDESQRLNGVGGLLVARACDAARAAGFGAVVLVGDEPYFARYGFSASAAAAIALPGPVDRRRVLANILAPGGEDLSGPLRA